MEKGGEVGEEGTQPFQQRIGERVHKSDAVRIPHRNGLDIQRSQLRMVEMSIRFELPGVEAHHLRQEGDRPHFDDHVIKSLPRHLQDL
jgi:hypothetical protein